MLWWERDVLVPAAAPAAPPGSGNDSIIGIQYSGSSDTGSSRADQSAARTSSTSAVHENAELAERAARLSFAALQRVPEASDMVGGMPINTFASFLYLLLGTGLA